MQRCVNRALISELWLMGWRREDLESLSHLHWWLGRGIYLFWSKEGTTDVHKMDFLLGRPKRAKGGKWRTVRRAEGDGGFSWELLGIRTLAGAPPILAAPPPNHPPLATEKVCLSYSWISCLPHPYVSQKHQITKRVAVTSRQGPGSVLVP